ncbi:MULTISPECIES: type II toxin-antitoxin system death-on-curing family toxin [Rahnella]|uniref:Type II toxin-antitoxin system death-on-curing family toxin n=1 Tax=Rahnella laticis TaxID=2787622 RepID=A0ABS0DZ96_9GAMM|nr:MULTISPECIES: type II toxin-antitoxin system death-on-curing family toxin [Rahnella]MBF7977901.1 type II toxin-antitoxin system death-on-curing family toxin [Rahnella laticis]MBF7998382.1 type II toxin-antitoxin system death-on-curing family toxin [Rahnella sp. LAC-M12]
MNELKFISAEEIIGFHERILMTTPGVQGLSDPGRVEAIISRVINLHEYESISDVVTLGAAHLIAVARGHVFTDGNKRTALMVALIFLRRNGVSLVKSDSLVQLTVDCAEGTVNLPEAAAKLRLLIKH